MIPSSATEFLMYQIGQLFLLPVLLLVAASSTYWIKLRRASDAPVKQCRSDAPAIPQAS